MSAAHGEQIRVLEEHGEQPGRSLEWWGMVFFIASEALFFANLIAAYLYLDIRAHGLGDHWHLENVVFPAINTLFLFASSGTMHWGTSAMRKGNFKLFHLMLAVTIVLGAIFLGGQAYEYTNLFHENFTISSGTFGSAFFTLTGFHGLHVAIGILFMIIVLLRSLRGHFSVKKHFAIEAAEMYWHFVDGVWVFVFSLVYLLPFLFK